MNRRGVGEKGAVAFLTVIVISLILTTITLGFIRLMTSEQRQATDDELTKRAYYAAESGIEDAKRAIIKYLQDDPGFPDESDLEKNGCEPAENDANPDNEVILSTNLDTAYTCQLISLRGYQYKANLSDGQSAVVPLAPTGGGFSKVRISWHENKSAADGGNDPALLSRPAGAPGQSLPQQPSWPGNVAMMRAEFLDFNFPINSINSQAAFLNPPNGGAGTANLAGGAFNNQIFDGSCNTSGDYACSIVIDNVGVLASQRYLRLTPVYRNTNVMVELLDGSNNVIEMEDAQARIDVTGRAGDIYRRVQKTIDLISPGDLSNYALLTDRICKRFYVTNNVSDFNDECANVTNGGSEGSPPTAGGSVAGNAAIGNFGGGGGVNGPVRHWMRSWPNASVYNDPNTVRGCKWEFGHNGQNVGTPPGFQPPDNPVIDRSNSGPVSPCRNGDRVNHEFPIICTGAGGTFSSQDSRAYTIRLTMYYTNGATVTDQRTEWIPRHTSQHSPLSTLPCRREQMP